MTPPKTGSSGGQRTTRRRTVARRLGPVIVLGAFVAVATIVSVSACGSSNDGLAPNPLATTSTGRRDSGAGTSGEDTSAPRIEDTGAVSEEASAAAKAYKGTLAETLPVKFGGSPYCDYTIKLKQIEIEIAALDTGEVISSTVHDTTVEAVVPPCPYGPAAPNVQSFSLATATPKGTSVALTFAPGKTNQPATSLVIDLVKSGASYEASATWKRTDQPAPLDWQVKAKLALTMSAPP